MRKDLHGLTLSTDSGTAVDAFDRATQAYLKYRTDAARHLGAALKADPEFALGHVVRGYFNMLAYNKANIQGAAEALAEARKHAKRTTTREAAHIEALARWVDGDLDRMLDVWRGIFAEHPHDVLAFRLHHFNAFWLGRPATMQAEVERVFPHWSAELPGWGTILSCRCFAHEEAGNYTLAEGAGRAGDRGRSRRPVGRPRDRPCARDAGKAERGHRLAEAARAQLGGRQQPQASPVLASRHVPHRTPRVRRGAVALRPWLPRPRLAAHPGDARHVHRRAERRLHAVPAGAPGRRCRRSLDRARRQGRGAHRRLPVGLHPAALDDGAGRDRPQRGGPAHDRGHARPSPAATARSSGWSAGWRCRFARRCWRIARAGTPRWRS